MLQSNEDLIDYYESVQFWGNKEVFEILKIKNLIYKKLHRTIVASKLARNDMKNNESDYT